jgi:hypothetical protein
MAAPFVAYWQFLPENEQDRGHSIADGALPIV